MKCKDGGDAHLRYACLVRLDGWLLINCPHRFEYSRHSHAGTELNLRSSSDKVALKSAASVDSIVSIVPVVSVLAIASAVSVICRLYRAYCSCRLNRCRRLCHTCRSCRLC
jgi:hypothetical protein